MEISATVESLPPVTPAFMHAAIVPGSGRAETTAALEKAERLVESHRYAEAIEALGDVRVPGTSAPDLALRVLHCEMWARLHAGEIETAVSLAERARALSEGSGFSDLDRAESLFRLGCCRLKLTRVSNAVSLFTLALRLVERGGIDGDGLRAQVFEWRSRCYQLQREWEAAESDAHSAAELAERLGDGRLEARATMQCSLMAERRGDPLLARFYAERARILAGETGDREAGARIVNNLGGLN